MQNRTIQIYLYSFMKFSQSHRQLGPQVNFTPPCNYYDPTQSHQSVLTGSLAGPSLPKEQTFFGLQKRFKIVSRSGPGPGSYNNPSTTAASSVLTQQRSKIRQTHMLAFIGTQLKSPSIPYHQVKMDEQQLQYVQQLLMAEDVNKSALSIKPKAQGFTFSKSPRVTMKVPDSVTKNNEQVPLVSIKQFTQQKEVKRTRNQMIQQVKKSNQRRQQIMNIINPQFVPSLELIQIITRRRTKYDPGPGTYSQAQTPRKEETGVSFSTTRRFSESNQSQLGPGQYKINQEKRKCASFTKSARNLFNMKNQTDLQHRFYIDPLKKVKQSNSCSMINSNAFGSKVIRFAKLEKQQINAPQLSLKAKKQSKLQQVVQKRLKKMHLHQKKSTCESQGLLGISTMASTIQ